MKNIEQAPSLPDGVDNREIPPTKHEKELLLREKAFRVAILGKLLTSTEDALYEANFTPEEIAHFKDSLNGLSDEEAKGVLATPFELRAKTFENFKAEISSGSIRVEDIVETLKERARKYGLHIGYHVSNVNIPPVQNSNGNIQWNIDGTELDDRDNMKMAYYSLDHKNLFRKKRGDYIYMVQARIGEGTSHKQDLNNHWGRAARLSIIDVVKSAEVEQTIDTIVHRKDQPRGADKKEAAT